MKCFECGEEAVVFIDDEITWKTKLIKDVYKRIQFKKALCKKHFKEIIEQKG